MARPRRRDRATATHQLAPNGWKPLAAYTLPITGPSLSLVTRGASPDPIAAQCTNRGDRTRLAGVRILSVV